MKSKTRIIAGALCAAVFAGAAYWWYDAHQSEKTPDATISAHSSEPAAAMPTQKVDSVEVMAERLRARLEKEPDDVNGWVLLGRSYHYLERWDDAKAAFAKARALGYRGDDEVAATNDTASDGIGNAVFADVGRVARSASANKSDSHSTTAADIARVRVAVDIAPALRAKFGPTTPVFVFARTAQGARMPLAAVRKTLQELPAEMDLDDSLAMMPATKISRADTIVLGARIAPSGNPIAQPGDVEVLSPPLSNWRGQRVSLLLRSPQ